MRRDLSYLRADLYVTHVLSYLQLSVIKRQTVVARNVNEAVVGFGRVGSHTVSFVLVHSLHFQCKGNAAVNSVTVQCKKGSLHQL